MMSHMFVSSLGANRHENGASVLPLPLNLIALIISYLDRPADLGRTCRTCRVFHYIGLPQLYSNVSLRSYDYIRYSRRDGRPDGCGMASPFSMGLNGLVARNVAGYVKHFEVCGEWKEHELEEHAKVGRVPDETMMLNSLVRAAVEKMAVLDSFSWALNVKMLPAIWHGLAQRNSLTKLTVRFPSSRHPRPLTLVPPIPNLQDLKVTDIDPLCYPDDISLLLLGSKKLRHLKLHWSPRMREARELSTQESAYFGRCAAARYSIPLKTVAVQNLYTYHDVSNCNLFDHSSVEEVTLLNSTGGLGDDAGTAFVDQHNWRKTEEDVPSNLKMLRIDKVSRQQCSFIESINGLEKLYLIGPQPSPGRRVKGTTPNDGTPLPDSPASSHSSPSSTDNSNIMTLKEDYIEAITKSHGRTLKHLLLLPQWRLTDDDIALIVRQCPNLEQLGIGAEYSSFKQLRLLVPFLNNLTAIRILSSPDDTSFVNKMREMDDRGMHEKKLSEETAKWNLSKLQYMELGGEDLIFEVGKREGGKAGWRKVVKKKAWEEVRDIAIWALDSHDL
ncbi:hypothetical protein HO133_001422 [Letharia lupina]|uniref:F-box domain-containing protein n=1 Tax=Letharia lupina TaxID=560253 RepID=A0A8H6FBS3_9LECA|nr:uncharacterized protein HO133_001422 [Letharia lupina]KAF6222336.1 hypothetical protein HO133_001422 [Letharia lupina]